MDLIAEHCEWSLLENHDYGALYEPTNFNVAAEQARVLDAGPVREGGGRGGQGPTLGIPGPTQGAGRIRRFPLRARVTPPTDQRVHLPRGRDQLPGQDAAGLRAGRDVLLVGHTHVPGVFTDEPDFYPPEDVESVYKLNGTDRLIINPGSVGQPRDLDPRASYAILDEDQRHVEFYRLPYDVESVAKKIHAVPELSNWLGDRLLEGR